MVELILLDFLSAFRDCTHAARDDKSGLVLTIETQKCTVDVAWGGLMNVIGKHWLLYRHLHASFQGEVLFVLLNDFISQPCL